MLVEKSNPMATWERHISSDLYPDLKMWAAETKQQVIETPESLGLPCYKQLHVPLGLFLENPDQFTSELSSQKYWFQLTSVSQQTKITVVDVHSDELQDAVASVDTTRPDDTSLLLSEYADNLFGGNIVVGEKGRIIAEFSEGLQGKVASQEVIPDFTTTSRPGTNTLSYSFEDNRLRSAIWSLVQPIRYLPGYYEFTILDGWRPIFLDARLRNPIYQIADPMQ